MAHDRPLQTRTDLPDKAAGLQRQAETAVLGDAIAELPRLSAEMRREALSYSKVRALTRVATPETEARLLDFARCATAAHVERLVRAWRRVDRLAAAEDDRRRHESRHLEVWVDDDGMLVVRGRLSPEVGAEYNARWTPRPTGCITTPTTRPSSRWASGGPTRSDSSPRAPWPLTSIAAPPATAIRSLSTWVQTA